MARKRSFSKALREARAASKLTQEEVAKQAKLSVRTVAGIEGAGDKYEPRGDTIRALARVYPTLSEFLPAWQQ